MEKFATIAQLVRRADELIQQGYTIVPTANIGANMTPIWSGLSAFVVDWKARGLPSEQDLWLQIEGWRESGYDPSTLPGYQELMARWPAAR